MMWPWQGVSSAGGSTATAAEPQDSVCPAGPILIVDRCPVCGSMDATAQVCRYNKFITYERVPDDACMTYDYALCHQCGVVYATKRPIGERYDWLFDHFEETIGRAAPGEERSGKLALSPAPLTDETREHLKRLASHGVFVSDHSGVSRKDYLPALLVDRMANAVHLEIIGSLLPLERPRVLEIRSRLGGLSAALERLYHADCSVMTLFQNQQYLIHEVYGIPARCPIDFDNFSIPFDGTFDLIIDKHIFNHAIHPSAFLATVRDHLRPGGHIYLYAEVVEAEFLDESHSMFNTMNPFHLQTFNTPSAVRALDANGFSTVFCTMVEGHLAILARRSEDVLAVRTRVARDWDDALARSLANGTADLQKNGRIKVRPPKDAKA